MFPYSFPYKFWFIHVKSILLKVHKTKTRLIYWYRERMSDIKKLMMLFIVYKSDIQKWSKDVGKCGRWDYLAVIVSAPILDSANAISSGNDLSKWWQTISMSTVDKSVRYLKEGNIIRQLASYHVHLVYLQYGRVGFVDDGKMFSFVMSFNISGAWPIEFFFRFYTIHPFIESHPDPPAPSVW